MKDFIKSFFDFFLERDLLGISANAYRKLKKEVYYESVDLFLRHRIAEFEKQADFQDQLKKLDKFLLLLLNEDGLTQVDKQLKIWLDSVNFRIMPKSLAPDKNVGDDFITNNRIAATYEISKVNYFIEAPIQIHIIDCIWCILLGGELDRQLDEYCMGSRLAENHTEDYTQLFKIFHNQYSTWRDTAIKKAQNSLENGSNVLIVGLDIKQFFYNLETRWKSIKNTITNNNGRKIFLDNLCDVLAKIQQKYHDSVHKYSKCTHKDSADIIGLPVGLLSSRIIANWELRDFDLSVREKLNPTYYGRYVDDIIIVLSAHKVLNREEAMRILIDNKILTENDTKEEFCLYNCPSLKIQKDKLIFQFFDASQSHAGLKEFSKEIAEQASEFRFLPVGDDSIGPDECAYDIVYKGSINKLRSVVGLTENSTELSKYLSRRTFQYRLTKEGIQERHIEQLSRFYKGRNIFDHVRLWEKVFTLLVVNGKTTDALNFYDEFESITKALQGTKGWDNGIITQLKSDMCLYLDLALGMAVGLLGDDFKANEKVDKKNRYHNGRKIATLMRKVNMIRHQFVSYPLLNYTNFSGNLTAPLSMAAKSLESISLEQVYKNIQYSPRYIHWDEIQLFSILISLKEGTPLEKHLNRALKVFKEIYKHDNEFIRIETKGRISDINITTSSKNPKKIWVGLANMDINDRDILNAYKPKKYPNLSYKRQAMLSELLNNSIRKEHGVEVNCDLVVFPEVSIPFAWLPIMVAFARRHQVGLVFGLEHIIRDRSAHNIVVTLLPYEDDNKNKYCFVSARLKNHYSPKEKKDLEDYGYKVKTPKDSFYEIFHWRNVAFSVYNCFELTDIAARTLCKAKVDFLATVAWNKDIPYYDHILSSSARDLHCYIVHANTSEYGDSRIIAPKKTEEKDYIRVKGGKNSVLLKEEIDIAELRDFQRKRYDEADERFKPLPAEFESESVDGR